MFGGVDGMDWQDALWQRAVGPSSAQWQPGRAEITEPNAPPGADVGSTQKELFSGVSDIGWAGVGEPGAPLEHDRVASFDLAHATNGGVFLL